MSRRSGAAAGSSALRCGEGAPCVPQDLRAQEEEEEVVVCVWGGGSGCQTAVQREPGVADKDPDSPRFKIFTFLNAFTVSALILQDAKRKKTL